MWCWMVFLFRGREGVLEVWHWDWILGENVSLLCIAAHVGAERVVEQGGEVEIGNEMGDTPLWIAYWHDQLGVGEDVGGECYEQGWACGGCRVFVGPGRAGC